MILSNIRSKGKNVEFIMSIQLLHIYCGWELVVENTNYTEYDLNVTYKQVKLHKILIFLPNYSDNNMLY